jgi:hypothetical protein
MPLISDVRRTLEKCGILITHGWGWPFAAFDTPARRAQCQDNHDQTPERIAARGGLAPREALAIVMGVRWSWVYYRSPYKDEVMAFVELRRRLEAEGHQLDLPPPTSG